MLEYAQGHYQRCCKCEFNNKRLNQFGFCGNCYSKLSKVRRLAVANLDISRPTATDASGQQPTQVFIPVPRLRTAVLLGVVIGILINMVGLLTLHFFPMSLP